MFRPLLTVSLLILPLFSSAQININGKLRHRGAPVANANVLLLKNNSSVTSSSADNNGNFALKDIAAGSYLLAVSHLAYSKSLTLNLSADTTITIELDSNISQLKGIDVNVRQPLIEKMTDRTVFNVENSLTAAGADAFETLGKIPGVVVQNGKISLVGKSSVNIMVNGRLIMVSGDDIVNFLKSISSDNISKIEIISNPTAKYDAQGNSGIINIKMKKNNVKGYNGLIRLAYNQLSYPFYFAGANLNYNVGKFKMYGAVNKGHGASNSPQPYSINYADQSWYVNNDGKYYDRFLSGQAGVDYQVSKQTLLGIAYMGSTADPDANENINTSIYNKKGTLDSTLRSHASLDNKTKYNTVNLHFSHAFDSARKIITADADWYTAGTDNQRTVRNTNYLPDGNPINNSFVQFLNGSKQKINIYTFKTDLELNYNSITIKTGAKMSFMDNNSNNASYNWETGKYHYDSSQSNRFIYKENIQAAYIELSKTIGKFSMIGGLRGEYTQTNGNSVSLNTKSTRDYLKLFPCFSVSYNRNEDNIFNLNYGRRINRPGYEMFNPFRWYSNPYAYSEGNPFLQPSFTHNIEASYTYKSTWTNTLSYSITQNNYDMVTEVNNGSNVQVTHPLNFLKVKNYSYSSTYSNNSLKWFEHNSTLQIYYTNSESYLLQTLRNQNSFGAYVSADNQFVLNKSRTVRFGASGFYQFPYANNIWKYDAYYKIDLALKFTPKKSPFQYIISANDIFRTNKQIYHTEVNGISQTYSYFNDNVRFKFLIRYKFGNDKITHTDRQTSNADERGRTGKNK